MNSEIAKYLLAINLVVPCSPVNTYSNPYLQVSTSDFPTAITGESFNSIKELYDSNIPLKQRVFNRIICKFKSDIEQYPELIGDNLNAVNQYFNKTLELLSPIFPDNIVFSLTNSESLYFRIYKGNKEINLEVFYSKYDSDDNIEAVVNVYEKESLCNSNFGSLTDLFYSTIYERSSNIPQSPMLAYA